MIRAITPAWAGSILGGLLLGCAGSDGDVVVTPPSPPPAPLYAVEVHHPASLGVLDTDLRDASDAVVGIACATCHAPGRATALVERGAVPAGFHGGIQLAHAALRCASCHDPTDRTRLRLADGEAIAMRDVIQLCGQCHGSQHRDFRQGAHGGGRGYWDRSRGPWIRNSCVACHAPHAPAYPTVLPAPPPNDRFVARHPNPDEGPTHE